MNLIIYINSISDILFYYYSVGTASVKEFYKRNNQWTEGLISAAKSVAQGANFLV